jgi:chromosomal replication initiator protein
MQDVVMEDSQFAAALSKQLAERIGEQRFQLWFGSQAQLRVRRGRLSVRATSIFVRDWIQKHFSKDIQACWESIYGQAAEVEFEVSLREHELELEETLPPIQKPRLDERNEPRATAAEGNANSAAKRAESTLAGYIVGASNEYAYRAAELTVSGRQQASLVFFVGETGVGKTHLLRSIVGGYRRHHPRSTATYLSAEQFTTSFIEAIRGSGLPSFRQKCRGAQLLAIDDLQFFAGKQRTLEELLHTIDSLTREGRQLIVASDRPLADLRPLGQEIVSRLAGGLVCEIQPPEFATRVAILRSLARNVGVHLDDEVLSVVATQITAGARELRGAVLRLEAIHQTYQQPITRDLASQVLGDLARHSTCAVKLADVQKVICEAFGVEPSQLRSDRKSRSLSEPRMLAMWLARKYTRAPWSEIGEYFGRRSHSTVIAAHKRVEKLISAQAQIGMNHKSCAVEEAIRKLESALRTA